MNYNPSKHHRRSIRLKRYDYSQAGLYFITICTDQRKCLFGQIINGKIVLNKYGKILKAEWEKSEIIRDEIKLHEFIIMPNHFHCIVEIIADGAVGAPVGANGRSPVTEPDSCSPVSLSEPDSCLPVSVQMKSKSVSSLIAGFKSSVTIKINQMRFMPGKKLWQRNYWEHIIRNQDEYKRISKYIINNPVKWQKDKIKK